MSAEVSEQPKSSGKTSAAEAFGELVEQIEDLRADIQDMERELGRLADAVRNQTASFDFLERRLEQLWLRLAAKERL